MANENTLTKATSWVQNAKEYFEDLQKEMRLVTWPSRKQVVATTSVVVASVFIFAVYFAIVDQIFARGVTQIFTWSTK